MNPVHDWVLDSIVADWAIRSVSVVLIDRTSVKKTLTAHGVRRLSMRHDEPWGESASVLSIEGPERIPDEMQRLVIRIQSGDDVEIDAERFDITG